MSLIFYQLSCLCCHLCFNQGSRLFFFTCDNLRDMLSLCAEKGTGVLEMHYMHYNYSIRQKQGHPFVFSIAYLLEREFDEWNWCCCLLLCPECSATGMGQFPICKLKWDLLRTSVTACTIQKIHFLPHLESFM